MTPKAGTTPASAFAEAAGAVAHVRDVALERMEKVVATFESTVDRLEAEIKDLRKEARKTQKAYAELVKTVATETRHQIDKRRGKSRRSKKK